MASGNAIKVQVQIIGANDPASPPMVLQVTQMVDTYMLWIGAVENISDIGAGENAVLSGNLCKDWACAMPPTTVRDSVASKTRAKAFAGCYSRAGHPQRQVCFDRQVRTSLYRWHNV